MTNVASDQLVNSDVELTALSTPKPFRSPKKLSQKNLAPYSGDQELEPFAKWVGDPIWVPPKDSSAELARSMLNGSNLFSNRDELWKKLMREHRSDFTQVRQIEMPRASIRLPQGHLYVSVTERKDFGEIEETIPNCVQTRLDEFMDKHGNRRGVKVYYLKPLCIESDDQLVFTTQKELDQARSIIREEVFAEFQKQYPGYWCGETVKQVINGGLAIPRVLMKSIFNRKKREIEAFHAQLEFERRKRALEATETYREYRTLECSYEEMLSMSKPLEREAVIDQYVAEQEMLAHVNKQMFMVASAVTLPWFVTLAVTHVAAVMLATTVVAVPLCDPAFVAVMPGCKNTLFKIGHFDEVGGVMHVEI